MSALCCPTGYIYIDNSGYYEDDITGLTMIVNSYASTPTFDQCLGKCGLFHNHAFADTLADGEECQCCPTGYTLNVKTNKCIGPVASDIVDPIPCILPPCMPPPLPLVCESCDIETLPINFSFDENKKNCTNCNVQGLPDLTPFGSFIADKIISPLINFIRR